jgi:hypothetical protein
MPPAENGCLNRNMAMPGVLATISAGMPGWG